MAQFYVNLWDRDPRRDLGAHAMAHTPEHGRSVMRKRDKWERGVESESVEALDEHFPGRRIFWCRICICQSIPEDRDYQLYRAQFES